MTIAAAESSANGGFWFTSGALTNGELAVVGFQGTERVSGLSTMDIDIALSADSQLEPAHLVSRSAALVVGATPPRYFHGVVAKCDVWGAAGRDGGWMLRVCLVPKLWLLTRTQRSRHFQGMTTPEIVARILTEHGVEHRMELGAAYARREFCVQYRESDFDFISRLLEEEGICYRFEQGEKSAPMVLADTPSSFPRLAGGDSLAFRPERGRVADEHALYHVQLQLQMGADAVALSDYSFLHPRVDMNVRVGAKHASQLEVFDHPGRYCDPTQGAERARVRLEELQWPLKRLTGQTFCSHVTPGATFELSGHEHDVMNGRYLILEASHLGRVGGQGDAEHGAEHQVSMVCIPASVPYRPSRITARPVATGAETAIVVGPPGEEVFTDEHGRVRVRFTWDRDTSPDETASCWIRVGQSWAGPAWGTLYLPRVGQEVVVQFEDGDPDRPMITGAVYNGQHPLPFELPQQKTRSTLRSSSSPGGTGNNEITFEDAAGAEELYIQAQRNLEVVVKSDKAERVGGNEELRVGSNLTEEVGGNRTVRVTGNETVEVGGSETVRVGGERTTTVQGAERHTIGAAAIIQIAGDRSETVGGASVETVSGAKVVAIGGDLEHSVGASRRDSVAGDRVIDVTGSVTASVGKRLTQSIGGSVVRTIEGDVTETLAKTLTLDVGQDVSVSVGGRVEAVAAKQLAVKAREITLQADEAFTLVSGDAKLRIAKNGEITISGGKVTLSADGKLTLKGSKLGEN